MSGLTACQTIKVSGKCPPLAAPPKAAVAALRQVKTASVDAWVIELDRHYQKLEVCLGL